MINRSIECRRHVEVEATLRLALEIALEKEYLLRKTGQSYVIEPIITAIKEALAQPAVTESHKQKPVAWEGDCVLGHCGSPAGCEASNCCRADSTTPPQRKPLTVDQIRGIYEDCDAPNGGLFTIAFTRAIEAAHGIKE